MAEQILKVTPQEVKGKANQIKGEKSNMEGIMNNMVTNVSKLESFWKATSGKSYVGKFQSLRQDIQDSLNRLEKHTNNLVQAAQKYEEVETEAVQKVNSLSVENIF